MFPEVNFHTDYFQVRTRKTRPPMSSDSGQTAFPSQTNSSTGYSPIRANTTNGPSSFHRPHSSSHHSDPGDTRYLKSAPDYMVPGPSLHSAVSTPDLRAIGQEAPLLRHHTSLPPRDMYYHYGNPDYPSARARDFQSRPERRMLASRSLSDLSTFDGNDSVFISNSPTALQRTFVYPNYEGAPQYAQTFHIQPDNHSGIYNSNYTLSSSGSSPDLRSNFAPLASHYYTPHSGRSSPTPSQYSDYSTCTEPPLRSTFMPPYQTPRPWYSDNGVSTIDNGSVPGLRRWDRSSTRDSENYRGSSEPPNGVRGSQPLLRSGEWRAIDTLSSPGKNPTNKSSTEQRSLQSSDFTKKNDSSRTSNDTGRERSSTLSRTLSLTDIGDEKKRTVPNVAREMRRDSLPIAVNNAREKYPLARVPIPSFREFKQRNLLEETKNKPFTEKKDANEKQSQRSPRADSKTESKSKVEMRGKLKERLSSLYESSKDISAQNSTKKLSGSYKSNLSDVTDEKPFVVKSSDLTESKANTTKDIKESRSTRKISKGRRESPFSKNEVIHNLMLKYGLYEKGGHKKTGSPRIDANNTALTANKINSDENEINSKNLKHISSATNSENASSKEENSTRNSSQLNGSTPKGSPVSARKAVAVTTTESKKSAAERFRELRRKHGLRNDPVDSRTLGGLTSTSKGKTTELNLPQNTTTKEATAKESLKREENDSGFFDQSYSGERRRNDRDSTAEDIRTAKSNVLERNIAAGENSANQNVDSNLNSSSESSSNRKSSIGLRGTSRAIICATKFKRATNKGLKSPNGSPLPDKKKLGDIITNSDSTTKIVVEKTQNESSIEVKRDESFEKRSPNDTRRRRFRTNGKLRKGGIHTSMLSVASNTCLTDSEVDDTVSLYSEMDDDDERGTRGRRWESFHSNMSADSGSAHMFEFETDSNATEYDEVFDDQDSGGETWNNHLEMSVQMFAMLSRFLGLTINLR